MELDAFLGADLLFNEEGGALDTVVSLQLKYLSVLGILNNASVAAEELSSRQKQGGRVSSSATGRPKGRIGSQSGRNEE